MTRSNNRGVPTTALLALLGAVCLFLHGCAGTATGKATSTYGYEAGREVLDLSRSPADAWVILRYPAMIEQGAESTWFDAYAREAIGGSVDRDGWVSLQSEDIAKGMIAKSNFYAMSLYRELVQELPPNSVLLSPHLVFQDEEGRLASRPMLATESMPSVVTIDFMTYSFPDSAKMMNSPPLTFGDVVTPLAVVHSDHWMQPTTNGLLMASGPLIPTAWIQSAELAEEEFAGRLEFRPIDDGRTLDFVRFLNGETETGQIIPTKPVRNNRLNLGAVEDYPIEKIILDGELVGNWVANPAEDPFEKDFASGVGTRLEKALELIDHDRATFSDRQKLLASFDPELAFAFMAHSEDESVRARLALAEKLIEAERRFLAAQSQKIYEGVYEGSFGNAMREMIVAEFNNLEERRSLARRQNVTTALAVLAMAGAAYAGANVFDNGIYDSGMALASDALLIGSLAALESSFATNQLNKQVGEGFLSQMAPAITEQITVQVRLVEGEQEISARDYAEFRQKTLALYQDRARSMTVNIETDCTFRHPAASRQGRWYGECFNGMATGRGYGVVRTDERTAIEYIGDASSGTANGQGAMIVHESGAIGGRYFEGGFRDGRPHGEVRVAEPGKAATLRRFEDGVDRGRGDEDEWQAFRFN